MALRGLTLLPASGGHVRRLRALVCGSKQYEIDRAVALRQHQPARLDPFDFPAADIVAHSHARDLVGGTLVSRADRGTGLAILAHDAKHDHAGRWRRWRRRFLPGDRRDSLGWRPPCRRKQRALARCRQFLQWLPLDGVANGDFAARSGPDQGGEPANTKQKDRYSIACSTFALSQRDHACLFRSSPTCASSECATINCARPARIASYAVRRRHKRAPSTAVYVKSMKTNHDRAFALCE